MSRPRHAVDSWLAPLAACALLAVGCDRLPVSRPEVPPGAPREDLRMGYALLADALAGESHLRALKILKKLTFRAPHEDVADFMDVLSSASRKRKKELAKLRELEPDVTGEPARRSPVGDAISAAAKEAGKNEMLDREGVFNLRFVLLQAQATRMISAMATALAEHDPNAERRRWLREVSVEYEDYRDDIIGDLVAYVQGRRASQPD